MANYVGRIHAYARKPDRLAIQHEQLDVAPESNGLPAPVAPFVVTIRLYAPGP